MAERRRKGAANAAQGELPLFDAVPAQAEGVPAAAGSQAPDRLAQRARNDGVIPGSAGGVASFQPGHPGESRDPAGVPAVPASRLLAWSPEAWPVAPSWRPVIDGFFASDAGRKLSAFIARRLQEGAVIYPPRPLRALELTPLERVHAVVLGQDPYHGPGQAEGLAFSVAPGVKLPPSLRNIYKELGGERADGSLVDWAERGVLLLNTSLTVEDGAAASHAGKGWEVLTDALIAEVAATASPCVYLLWGAHAQAKAALIERTAAQHGREVLVLQANHPSPLSARRPPVPFIGCGHFATAREWLAGRGVPDIFLSSAGGG